MRCRREWLNALAKKLREECWYNFLAKRDLSNHRCVNFIINNITSISNFVLSSGADIILRLSDNAGASKVSIEDSDEAEVAYIDSNGNGYFASEVGIGVSPSARLTLPAGTAAAGTAPLKFTPGVLLTTPEAGVLEFYDDRLYLTNVAGRRALDRTSDVITSTTTVSNTTNETTLFTGSLPTNALKTGNILEIHASGDVSNASASDDITIRVYYGTTVVSTYNPAMGNVTNADWHIDFKIVVRTVGGAGTLAYQGIAVVDYAEQESHGLAAVDTTISEDITVTVEWDNAKAGNVITSDIGYLEFKN